MSARGRCPVRRRSSADPPPVARDDVGMTVPMNVSAEPGGPTGYTYAAALLRAADDDRTRDEAIATLRRIRFTGWVAPAEKGWVPVLSAGDGTVASGRRGVVGVGQALAEAMTATCVVLRVQDDRQLVVVAWESGLEVARYVSDPSREPNADSDVLS